MAYSCGGSDCYRKPIILSITTRGIGINLCSFFADAIARSPRTEQPDINAVYRAMLAIVETKFTNIHQNGLRSSEHIYRYNNSRLRNIMYGNFWIPLTLQRLVDAIGNITDKTGAVYFPAMSENTEIDGKFVPRPENILLTNLRETVVTLADSNDSEAAVLHRKNFYLNNPIPAAKWDQNYTLINADTIMPAEYDYDSHLKKDLHALACLPSSYRFMKFQKVSYENHEGSISSLMCSEMSGLRTPDLRPEDLTLTDYYRHAEPENGINDFYSCDNLNEDEVFRGATMLLGERPVIDNCPHHSVYAMRSKALNPFSYRYKTTYKDILLEESKLTVAQRRKSALKLREHDERKADTELACMPLVRPRTSRRRSLSTIRESGIFDTDSYQPLKRGEDRDKMKERLAYTMAYGDEQEQRPQPPPPIVKKPQPKLPTSKQKWNELVTQIRERTEWLAEMEYLGQAGPHRDIIKDQIAERMRALDALGIDSGSSTPKSSASGFSTTRSQEPDPVGHRRSSTVSVPSSRSDKSEKKRSVRSTIGARNKEENVMAYSQLSPLQYTPRRRQ